MADIKVRREVHFGVRYTAQGFSSLGFAWFASKTDAEDFLTMIRAAEPGIGFEVFPMEAEIG